MYFEQHTETFSSILNQLKGKQVAIFGHLRPDGDCVGSQVALCRVLRTQGIDAIAVNSHPAPRILQNFIQDTPFLTEKEFKSKDYISINVDCADEKRIGSTLAKRYPKPILNIDHHISNPSYGEHNIVEPTAAATAEILTGLFLDNNLPIDPISAEALYVGIATDTGQYLFPNTTSQVFSISAKLVDLGANPGKVGNLLYHRENFPKLALLQTFLASLKLECNDQVCIGFLEDADYEKTAALPEDTEGFVNYTRSLENIKIGAFIDNRQGNIKVSLRANNPSLKVDQIAKQFGGGGHACAAGLSSTEPIDIFYPKFIESLNKHLTSLKS